MEVGCLFGGFPGPTKKKTQNLFLFPFVRTSRHETTQKSTEEEPRLQLVLFFCRRCQECHSTMESRGFKTHVTHAFCWHRRHLFASDTNLTIGYICTTMHVLENQHDNGETTINNLKMYGLLKTVIFQLAMLVYSRNKQRFKNFHLEVEGESKTIDKNCINLFLLQNFAHCTAVPL